MKGSKSSLSQFDEKTNRELIEEWMVCARLQSGCLIIRNKQTNCPLWSDSNYLQLFTYWPRQHSAAARFSWSKSLTQFFTKTEHKQFLSGSCYYVSSKQCLWLFWQPPPSTDNHKWWWWRRWYSFRTNERVQTFPAKQPVPRNLCTLQHKMYSSKLQNMPFPRNICTLLHSAEI